jgi:hypothetical protein
MDQAFDQVRAQLDGKPAMDITFGRLSLKEMRPEEIVDLFVVQYLVRAVRPATAASRC